MQSTAHRQRSLHGRLTSPCPPQHMREAAERRQQLELEHEQALAVLNAKQQEIDLLQKVRGCTAWVRGQREEAGPRLWVRAGCAPSLVTGPRVCPSSLACKGSGALFPCALWFLPS